MQYSRFNTNPSAKSTPAKEAVVIGGRIAGVLSARVLADFPQVHMLQAHAVDDLCTDITRSHVTGVRVRSRQHSGTAPRVLHADLVVDASGRHSAPPKWLVQEYFNSVLRTLTNDAAVAEAFFHVQNMINSPATLFHPQLLWHVWRAERARTGKAAALVHPQYKSSATSSVESAPI